MQDKRNGETRCENEKNRETRQETKKMGRQDVRQIKMGG